MKTCENAYRGTDGRFNGSTDMILMAKPIVYRIEAIRSGMV